MNKGSATQDARDHAGDGDTEVGFKAGHSSGSRLAPDTEVLLDTIEGTARALKVGRSTIYELLKKNQLEAVKIGRSTRIPVASRKALVERLSRSTA
jgi:excisionase family DNA binding protein